MASSLGLSQDQFEARHCDVAIEGGWRRLTSSANGCTFLTREGGCGVYEDRPTQCRTYPFWQLPLASPATWNAEREVCEGIGRVAGDPASPRPPPEPSSPAADCSFEGGAVDLSTIDGQAQRWAMWLRQFPSAAAANVGVTERWAKDFVAALGFAAGRR